MQGPAMSVLPKSGRMRRRFPSDASSQVDPILGGRGLSSHREGVGPLKTQDGVRCRSMSIDHEGGFGGGITFSTTFRGFT